ncbi:MAG: DUF2723 domain-containing protein [Candidatus Zixiibacteriota bacterium]
MEPKIEQKYEVFDRTNAIVAGIVTFIAFIVYYLTVAPTLSYWDCGEFIACSYILGIPHPPGSPVYIVMGRLFSLIPWAIDICYRINLLSVISSAVAVMFGYLSLVRMIKYWYRGEEFSGWRQIITYLGAAAGALFMAFSSTYWGNAIEAEVYGLSMTLMTMILWLALKYYESNDRAARTKIVVLISFLAMLGVGVHLSTFLIMPVAAIFLVLKKDAPAKAYMAISLFFVAELLFILILSDGRGGYDAFKFVSVLLLLGTAFLVYKHIKWPILIGIGSFSMIMVGYYWFIFGVIFGVIALIIMATVKPESDWKTGIAIILVAILGFSFNLFIPIRSAQNPRIDENNADRNFSLLSLVSPSHRNPFINYLERKQYGSESMVERMFQRRGTFANQFGRHAHMGYWSYFEKQYGMTSIFGFLFLMGLYGIYFGIKKNIDVNMPFLIMLLFGSVGLILYMNFADGVMYSPQTGDAYMEVRNRDYFFTPAYAYFGLALGMGIAALMELVRSKTSSGSLASYQKPILSAMCLLVLLPGLSLSANYYENNHSKNYFPRIYSENILNTCEPDAVLFTSGDNDTFPLWCVQEVYDFRKDVRVVNLSLFNTDWYVYQMKWQYDVPISLTRDQIEWNDYEVSNRIVKRPAKPFVDRARKKRTYLIPLPDQDLGRTVKLQDMMVDEVVIENNGKVPIYFSSQPYVESPLNLRDKTISVGVLYKLDSATAVTKKIDSETGYRLYKDVYQYTGLDNPDIYRDENATGVMLGLGFNALRIADDFYRHGDTARAIDILQFITEKYPESAQCHELLAQYYNKGGDSAKADSVMDKAEATLAELVEKDPDSQFYLSDYGSLLYDRGNIEEAIDYLWRAFNLIPNSGYAYQKLGQVLYEQRRISELIQATQIHANYKINRSDPMVQQILNIANSAPLAPQPAPSPIP